MSRNGYRLETLYRLADRASRAARGELTSAVASLRSSEAEYERAVRDSGDADRASRDVLVSSQDAGPAVRAAAAARCGDLLDTALDARRAALEAQDRVARRAALRDTRARDARVADGDAATHAHARERALTRARARARMKAERTAAAEALDLWIRRRHIEREDEADAC